MGEYGHVIIRDRLGERLTKNATGTVSKTAMLVNGTEKILDPRGNELLEGADVPHWYKA